MRRIGLLGVFLSLLGMAESLFVPPQTLKTDMRSYGLYLLQGRKEIASVHSEPRGAEDQLEFRFEKDCLVMDLSRLKALPQMPKIVINWYGIKQKEFPYHAYNMSIDIASSAPQSEVGLYFEGQTVEKTHYWKLFKKYANSSRQTLAAANSLPLKLNHLHCRFDFYTPDVFRIYDVAFTGLDVFEKPSEPRTAELLFHAGYDGTAKAEFAKGNPEPTQAENLSYKRGLKGQALHATKAADTKLAYDVAKNFQRNAGAISLWVCPQWGRRHGHPGSERDFHCFVSMEHPIPRWGAGTIWFWAQGETPRWDTSDILDSYGHAPIALQPDRWYHLVMNWDEDGGTAYINGQPAASHPGGDGYSPLRLTERGRKEHLVRKNVDIRTFYVGCLLRSESAGHQQADALIDELRIYSAPLSPAQIQKLNREFAHFQANMLTPYVLESPVGGSAPELRVKVTNLTDALQSFTWNIVGKDGKVVNKGPAAAVRVGPGEMVMTIAANGCGSGDYTLNLTETSLRDGIRTEPLAFHVLSRRNVWSAPKDAKLELEPVTTIRPHDKMSLEEMAVCGRVHMGQLNGRAYLETDDEEGSRFALRAKLPDAKGIYLFEFDYPDDKARSCDIIVQSARGAGNEYELQNGYCSGAEYPNTQKMLTHRCLYFPRSQEVAVIMMGARPHKPAALAELRISKVRNGLPEMAVREPKTADGDQKRHLGIYFEDPAINYDFGGNAENSEMFPVMLDRMVAYMKYSGQDLLTYPMVWYHGRIGERYNPRSHVSGFMEAFLEKFDLHDLSFMPSFNWHNLYFDDLTVTQEGVDAGAYHDSPIAIWDTGKPNPGRWHGSPPNYNVLHPRVQKAIMDEVDYFISVGAMHKSFKGITLHNTLHCLASLGNLSCGYNDYAIDAFSKETGIAVPIDRSKPLRGKDYAEWLRAHAWEAWKDFRCRRLAEFYKVIAKHLKDARSDLRLVVVSFNGMTFLDDQNFRSPDHTYEAVRAGGIDVKYLNDADNIVFVQGDYPADYRWREHHGTAPRYPENYEFLVKYDSQPGFFRMLQGARTPWLHMHDRYWESAIGRSGGKVFRKVPWLQEMGWRVSTLNPSGFHAMRHYVLPLRYVDLQTITKGGFLIGTYGMEEYLIPFAKAFRALPAQTFRDVPYASETVKIRELFYRGDTYFYIVNTEARKDAVTVDVSGGQAVDLVTGKAAGGRIELEPYQLRSFKAAGKCRISVR